MRGSPGFSTHAFERPKDDPLSALREELRKSGVKVTHGAPFVTGPVRYAGFPENMRTFLSGAVDVAKHYLSGAVIEDAFGADHDARRAWRTEMQKKLGAPFKELDDSNKLRVNVIGNVYSYVGLLNEMVKDEHTPEAEALKNIAAELPKKSEIESSAYNVLSFEEKMAVVKRIDAVAEKLVALLAPKQE